MVGSKTDVREPGLIDLQVNGYAGFDVNADDITSDTIIALTRALWAEGVTTYLPTIITASKEKILHVLETIADARNSDSLIAHSIAGVHVEGPSLAEDDGPRGAHDRSQMRDPCLTELDQWQFASGGIVRVVTLAPERAGSLQYIGGAVARGVRISLGHCAASPDQIRAAAQAGATLSTHLGNGTYRTLPRHPNHIWAQLADDRLSAMLIADGHHLPADTLTAMVRAKGPSKCILTSDSAALAGASPGRYTTPVGGSVTVTEDGRLEMTGVGLPAGSGRSLRECLAWAHANLPFRWESLFAMVTTNPAGVLGMNDRVSMGRDVVVREGARVLKTYVDGAEVFNG